MVTVPSNATAAAWQHKVPAKTQRMSTEMMFGTEPALQMSPTAPATPPFSVRQRKLCPHAVRVQHGVSEVEPRAVRRYAMRPERDSVPVPCGMRALPRSR